MRPLLSVKTQLSPPRVQYSRERLCQDTFAAPLHTPNLSSKTSAMAAEHFVSAIQRLLYRSSHFKGLFFFFFNGFITNKSSNEMAAAQEAMLRPVTWGDAGGHGADTRNHPVGMHGDEFDKMFGAAGMGGHETQRQTRASVPAGPVRDLRGVEQQQIDSYTSSHERIYYELEQQGHARQMPAEPETGYLHPDTLMPMPRGASVHRGERPVDGGWAVGFVVADGGVIRKIVPQAPADRAELVQESTEGVWEGKCCVGDRVNSSLPLLAPLAAFWITPMQPSTCPTGFCNGVTDTWLSSCCSAVLCQRLWRWTEKASALEWRRRLSHRCSARRRPGQVRYASR